MQIFTTKSRIVITCHKWLATALEAEVVALGYEIEQTGQTSVMLIGTLQDCIRLNLNLRSASQVMYSLKAFSCKSPDDLYNALSSIAWEKLMQPDGYFSVTSSVSHPTITNGMFANLRVKDAIVDYMRDKANQRPSTGSELKGVVFNLFWKYEEAEIFIDTSGETLTKHGYRKLPGKAPMLEALAAATILTTKWDQKAPFINPMCGSGTLAIEAALIATNRTPGLLRNYYAFMHLNGYEQAMYNKERKLLDEKIKKIEGLKIIATDISSAAIATSKTNAEAAGVAHLIDFAVCDFERTNIPKDGNGVVMLNPEYGERLGVETELEAVYARIGDFMKNNCKGYIGYIFTGNLELAKKIRLKPSKRTEFYNATIDCRLLEYQLYAGTRRTDKLVDAGNG